jgi:hypothetical protein
MIVVFLFRSARARTGTQPIGAAAMDSGREVGAPGAPVHDVSDRRDRPSGSRQVGNIRVVHGTLLLGERRRQYNVLDPSTECTRDVEMGMDSIKKMIG